MRNVFNYYNKKGEDQEISEGQVHTGIDPPPPTHTHNAWLNETVRII